MHFSYITYPLVFHRPAGTSRGVLNDKKCWFVKLTSEDGRSGLGEVSFIPGLSLEDAGEIETGLIKLCDQQGWETEATLKKLSGQPGSEKISKSQSTMSPLPGIRFALESALADLENGGKRILYASDFTRGYEGIPINGLIWMGSQSRLKEQIREKLELGFRVLKMKVGAMDMPDELEVLDWIRKEYPEGDLEIRLDANGAWTPAEALDRMHALEGFHIHSIEQPIMPGQEDKMAELCTIQSIPIALDEELIGINRPEDRRKLIEKIKPSYIILKPGLLGGLSEAEDWISIAEGMGTGWWVTSALESDIGLNAIAQWTFSMGINMPQGLGTGSLYCNNIPSPLVMEGDRLWHRPGKKWKLSIITEHEQSPGQ
ncbi:MAG TPA: o-succinylbenzoate synthase [Bacteroides sp.]|nr:o-succinylbenzoate synthase [Bacteroides sp.]